MECPWISMIVIWGTCPAPGRPTSESRSSWRTSKFSQNPSAPRHTMTYFCKAVFSVPRTKSTLFFHDSRESPHSALTSYIFLSFSISFLDVSWCLCIFLYFVDPKIKGADSAAATRIFGRFLGVPDVPRKTSRKGATGRAATRPLPLFRFGGSVAQPASDLFAKLSISPHRTRKNLSTKYEWNALKCIEMQQNLWRSETKKKVLLFFSCQATGTPTTWVVFPWRGSILTTRLSDAAWDFFDWKSLHLCLSINMIFIIFLIDSSCISFLWCSLRCLRCLLVGLWPCCASTLDSTERSHGPWPVGVRTGSTSLGPMAQKFKLNPKTCMKFREIFIHQHHRITSIRMAANLCNNATKMYQIWSEQWIQYIHFHITRTEIPPRHSRPSNRQRKGAGTSASRARRSWPHDTSRGECSSWVFWMFLVWKTWIFWFSFRV